MVVKYVESCDCSFYWYTDEHGVLVCDEEGQECWTANVLLVDGREVAAFVRFEGFQILEDFEIPEDIRQQMRLPYTVERGEIVNRKHHARKREALVHFLMEGHYEPGRDNLLGFGNEYLMFLRRTETPIQVSREEAEKWADAYLYYGDAVTQAFVYFELR